MRAAIFGGGVIGYLGGVGIGLYAKYQIDQYVEMVEGQIINSTTEYYGPPTYRQFSMNMFKTTEQQEPLSTPVKSTSSVFIFNVLPIEERRCGLVSIDLKGDLYLPFFYQDLQIDYGTYLPIPIEIHTMFPVFTQEG